MSVPVTAQRREDGAVRVDSKARRVIVYRLGSLGDTLVALPSLHLVARAFPNAERRMLTNVPVASRAPAAAAVLGESGLIHSYMDYPVGTRQPLVLLRTLWALRRFRPDVIVYLKATQQTAVARRDAMFLRLTGVKRIVGLPGSPEGVVAPLVAADGTLEPEAYRLARMLEELGDAALKTPAAWDLHLTAAELDRADRLIAPLASTPYFAVSIGTKVQAKDWGKENWSHLLRALAEAYPGYGLLLAGAAEEAALTEEVAEAWRLVPHAGPAMNVCGLLSPRESAAAFRRAVVFIGHDSGPMHLASVAGTPTVAVFASRNRPRTWFPVNGHHRVVYHHVDCEGCGLETCIAQRKKCILSITVQEVFSAVQQLINVTRQGAAVGDKPSTAMEITHVA